MSALAFLAFVAGLIFGFLFRPLIVVALAMVAVFICLFFGSYIGVSPLPGAILAVLLINFGYLAGAVITRRWRRSKDSDRIDR